jgi:sugar fermentation stimulation protein A
VSTRFEATPVPATFRARPNRFLGEVEMDGETVPCFIPDPGRLKELLFPGARVYLLQRASEGRKTRHDLVLVDLGGTLVSTDSRVPNKVVAEALNANLLPEFRDLKIARTEPSFSDSRLDFLLDGARGTMLLEVKSCTLVEGRTALFPDAPTERGRRHLRALVEALNAGRAAMLFLVQRDDADGLRPNVGTDPQFARALREASDGGVEVYAYNSRVTLEGISISRRIAVEI